MNRKWNLGILNIGGGAMACVRKATLLPLDNADEIKVCVIRLE